MLSLPPCSAYRHAQLITPCKPAEGGSLYSRAGSVERAIGELINSGVPGAAIAVYSDEGWWEFASGYAKIEDKVPMQTCHLQYLQSVTKTYLAVAVLKLYEEGRIALDSPMTTYLPEKYSSYIVDAEKVTVRMLLNHTSGIPEYNFSPHYVAYLLQHPDHKFEPVDYLKYIKNKPLDFAPGSRYSYRNTNYVILALITDALTGDHAQFIEETVFKRLDLTNTFYRNDAHYLTYPTIVNTYWDRYSDGIVENASRLQRSNVASLVGDDGIVATPIEAVKFLKGLMEGKLISKATLEVMKSWTNDSKGQPRYGLGLSHATINGHVAYGHSGGGIGAGCELYYFPGENLYIFIAINLGTVTDSPLHTGAGKAREKVYQALLD
ncbi:Serine-type D-Ala-D-Ala carboxypeptidase [Fulvivirga imtechensis AK7]|uniref:Serine-type D-Ala-D-Ala carboxypeptidase n=1 Tax=Fulvivirga imtechensis AK7 TaxID=1237149 RepID=L8JJM4_9BACT|nr:serine hydrolase domain-containing protein [Fulvivirga imtechensis]ELR69005.1 Serine-type D-Ala-D-Ala carboxypeptidase [Fulvivirga imtechensis AK7]